MFNQILENVRNKTPLVHNITNYVTVNDCANIILAGGGSPIMADDISEVCNITSICTSLVINIGTLNERTIESMLLAGKKANELGHPVILDPVGAGASALRNETTLQLLKEIKFAVIRGNISEIKFIAGEKATTNGVDASAVDSDDIDSVKVLAKSLSKSTGAVIAITGAIDIVADSEKAYIIKNGHPMMGKVTGTGCMLTSLIGAYVGANYDNILDASACAVTVMGLSGELAYEKLVELGGGTSTYRMYIIDFVSEISNSVLNGGSKIEIG
jgi:hydroxyethylthiazole kinase